MQTTPKVYRVQKAVRARLSYWSVFRDVVFFFTDCAGNCFAALECSRLTHGSGSLLFNAKFERLLGADGDVFAPLLLVVVVRAWTEL